MTYFFTADTHFYHANIIKYCKRPYSHANLMDHDIVSKWNSVVGKNDTVYHLGDVGIWYGGEESQDIVRQILYKLNGNIHLICGNHDKELFQGLIGKDIEDRFHHHSPYRIIYIPDEEMGIKQKIVLFHFPIEAWDSSTHGSWHLHGHTHGIMPYRFNTRVDVGVDTNDFYPYSFDDIKTIVTQRAMLKGDK